jgi:hypothetical protein
MDSYLIYIIFNRKNMVSHSHLICPNQRKSLYQIVFDTGFPLNNVNPYHPPKQTTSTTLFVLGFLSMLQYYIKNRLWQNLLFIFIFSGIGNKRKTFRLV